jgi:hypothetical protein
VQFAYEHIEQEKHTVSSLNYQRQMMPAVPSIDQFFNVIQRITAAHYEVMTAFLRVGSRNTVPSSADARAASTGYDAAAGNDQAAPTSAHADRADMEAPQTEVSVDLIRARAYELYERRGRQPGNAHDDWDRAQAELRAVDGGARADHPEVRPVAVPQESAATTAT